MNTCRRIFRKALERVGVRKAPFFIRDNPDFAHIAAGKFSYGKPLIMGWDGTPETQVTIGKFCSIADGVRMLLRVNHPIHSPSTYPLTKILEVHHDGQYEWSRGPIMIGHDVWIGQDAVIIGGVTINHGAVVANHAIVTKDVPPYGIVAGNPARLVKLRFDEPTIKKLLQIQWWNWSDVLIKKHAILLSMGKIDDFSKLADQIPLTSKNE
jgi:acetyltransferase-like isoleucine patch superfamily enzyme